MSGSSPPPPTQTTTTTPSPQAQEVLGLAMPGIRNFAAQVPQRYQGETLAPFDPSQLSGQQMALGAASPQASLASAGSNLTQARLEQDPNSMRDQAIAAAVRPIYQNLTEQTLPNLRSEAIGSGNFGGSREAIASGLASGRASQAAGDTAAKMSANIYDTDVKAQLQSLGLLPQTQQSLLAPATTTSGVGDVLQQFQQQKDNQAAMNDYYDKYAPYLQSKELLSLAQGIPGGTTTATGSTPTTQPGAMQALGGAAAGATLGSALFPGPGTAIGAGAGALLPFLFR